MPYLIENDLEPTSEEGLNLFSPNGGVADWNLILQDGTPLHIPQQPAPVLASQDPPPPPPYVSDALGWPLYSGPTALPSPFPDLVRVEETLKDLGSIPPTACTSRSCCLYASEQCNYSETNQSSDNHTSHQSPPPYLNDSELRYDLQKFTEFSPDINVNDIFKDSDGEESDIIVEDSETESEISISDVGSYPSGFDASCSSLRCIVCNVSFGDIAAVNFLHLSNTFPLTFLSKTPIMMKLIEIIPFDVQYLVQFENTLICRRCLELIDSVENLEFRLNSIKQELCNYISKPRDTQPPNNVHPMERPPCLYQQGRHQVIPTYSQLLPAVSSVPPHPPLFVAVDDSSKELVDSSVSPHVADKENFEIIDVQSIASKENDKEPAKEQQKSVDRRDMSSRYQCDRCGRTYSKFHRLTHHLAKHAGSFKYNCDVCQKGFMVEGFLQMHLRSHKKERPHQCPTCPASFKEESDFSEHVCRDKRFMCAECPRAYTTKVKLETHILITHRKKKHVCEVCKKEFEHRSDLALHATSHGEERPFQCEKCSASFKRVFHLNRHVLKSHKECAKIKKDESHVDDPPSPPETIKLKFKCPDCDKEFSDKRYLKAHEKIHQGTAKLNKCPLCNKSFRVSLKIHMVKHAATKQFKCEECDSEFSHKQALEKHIRRKHSNKTK